MTLLADKRRDPVQATARIVPPSLYEVVWNVALHGPLTAQEIAEHRNLPTHMHDYNRWTPQQAANRMRTLIRLGLFERDENGFYLLTPAGRRWVSTGAEG